MKKTIFSFLAAFSASVFAGEIIDDTMYPMDKLSAEYSANVQPGKDIEFKFEENCTTGYAWVASYDPRLCNVKIEHQAAKDTNLAGAPGYAEIEIKALGNAPFVVEMNYVRPWEKGVKPAKNVKIAFKGVPTAAAVVVDDATYMLKDIPAEMKVALPVGEDVEFDLEESPAKSWVVTKADSAFCTVKIEHDRLDDVFSSQRRKAEIEIKALKVGESVVEFTYGDKEKTLRIHVTAK